jgi:hypothetical protein
MKITNTLVALASAALASAALAMAMLAATASATTLETNGLKQSGAIELLASRNTSLTLKDTSGTFANTCTSWTFAFKDSTAATGSRVSGPLSAMGFSQCTHEPIVVDLPGSLNIEAIKGTTNGTVRWNGGKWTYPVTIFGGVVTATCVTSETDIGTLTGASSGTSTIDINGVITCGSFLPSARWEGRVSLTTTAGGSHAIGVVE